MSPDDRSLYSGLVRLHILHHSAAQPIYGAWIAEELARHGYKLSAGTLYPVLHSLEIKGYLRSSRQRAGRWTRRVYRTTPLGRRVLRRARKRVWELFGEMFASRTAAAVAAPGSIAGTLSGRRQMQIASK